MPKGVYERTPGRKRGGSSSSNSSFQSRKLDKNSFNNKKPNNGAGAPSNGWRGPTLQRKGIWIKVLADLGYGAVGRAPNRAVQYIFCLIANPEIHEVILKLNSNLPPNTYSPIIHLGFSAWLNVFLQLDKRGMVTKECVPILEQVFKDISDILADRTDLDDMLAIECKAGMAYLEKVHKIKDKGKAFHSDPMIDTSVNMDGVTQSFTKYIPKEDMEMMRIEGGPCPVTMTPDLTPNDSMVRLTLQNCLRFPIISEMAIEWLGEEFDHGLWRSQNYSTLAPISRQAWISIAGLNNDHMAQVEEAAKNMTKLIDKEDVEFPFGTALFDKKCQNNTGTTLFVKAHMAYPSVKREYNYLHRIWRSFSPYFKCNCTDSNECKDSITWFDQAIWFALNHLEMVYPRFSPAGRMGAFLAFIQQNLRKPVMAHLVYMQVRDMMVNVTNKLAEDSECNVQAIFGNSKLVDVCEMMIKDRKFMMSKYNLEKDEPSNSVPTHGNSYSHEEFLPPRVSRTSASASCQVVENIASGSESIVSCSMDEASVCKTNKPNGLNRTENTTPTYLKY